MIEIIEGIIAFMGVIGAATATIHTIVKILKNIRTRDKEDKPSINFTQQIFYKREDDYNDEMYQSKYTDRERLEDYLDACYKGDGRACNDAGVMIGDGKGAARDLKKSAKLYKKACKLGNATGCCNYARRLRKGKGVALDINKAKYYYEIACDLGNEEACEELDYL